MRRCVPARAAQRVSLRELEDFRAGGAHCWPAPNGMYKVAAVSRTRRSTWQKESLVSSRSLSNTGTTTRQRRARPRPASRPGTAPPPGRAVGTTTSASAQCWGRRLGQCEDASTSFGDAPGCKHSRRATTQGDTAQRGGRTGRNARWHSSAASGEWGRTRAKAASPRVSAAHAHTHAAETRQRAKCAVLRARRRAQPVLKSSTAICPT